MSNQKHPTTATLPPYARLSFNRCNLPAVILGGLTYQRHPVALAIDGVAELHRELFVHLDRFDSPEERAQIFMRYMSAHFRLGTPEDAGYTPTSRLDRTRADYLHCLQGWLFNPDGREAAVLKGWVESRFGLLPRFHTGPIRGTDDENYHHYLEARAEGLYNTNGLEAQLDVLYSYCQYELAQQHAGLSHLRLYRGVNNLDDYEAIKSAEPGRVVLLNNLNAFTDERDRADEFGDYIIETDVPLAKIFFYNDLLPLRFKGENEWLVIGGVYEITVGY